MLWVKSIGGPGFDLVYETALDNNDNILFTSRFSGTMDFDPGPGQFFLTGDSSGNKRDFAVGKFSSNGDFL